MAAAYVTLIAIVIRRPLYGRIALREAVRRPWQSALIVAGLMMASGAVLAANVFEDSQNDSVLQGAYQAWGRVDVLVAKQDGSYFSPAIAQALAGNADVRRSTAGVQAGVELISSVVDLVNRQSSPLTRFIGFDPAAQSSFGSFRLNNGSQTTGNNLQPGEVVISASLRIALGARVGDHLQLSVASSQAGQQTETADLVVAGVAEPIGPGAYGLRPAVFASLATSSRVSGANAINVIRISARGTGSQELSAAHALVPTLQNVLRQIPDASGFVVQEGKQGDVQAALSGQDPGVGNNAGFTIVLSAVVIIAGLALVINLMATLVEERRPRLAVLRALGLSRLGSVTVLSLEGSIYTLLAGIVGCLPGLLFGWILYRTAASGTGITDTAGSGIAVGRDLQVIFSVRAGSLALAISAGTAITLIIVSAAAVWNSRLTIAAAIRDLPEPRGTPRSSRLRWALTVVIGALSLLALLSQDAATRILGGDGLIGAVALATRGRFPDQQRIGLAGLAMAAWTLVGYATGINGGSGPPILIVGILFTTLGLAVATASNLRPLEGLIAAGGRAIRPRALARPMLAYMTRRPFRAGLTVCVFALVVTILVIYNALIAAFGQTARRPHSRVPYDIRVVALQKPTIVLPPAIQAEIADSLSLPTRTYLGPVKLDDSTNSGIWHQERLSLYEFTPGEVQTLNAGGMTNRVPQFADDASAWRTVEENPQWVVWTHFNIPALATLEGVNGPVSRQIAGDAGDPILDGIIGMPASLAPFSNRPLGTTMLLRTRPGVNPEQVARQLQQALAGQGAEVITIQRLLDAGFVGFQAFASVPELFMRMGLVVGILSLGVLAIRAVIDRRRAIGVLRALGYRRADILAVVMGEATLTTTNGALLGVLVGCLISYFYIRAKLESVRFSLDLTSLLISLGLMYVAVLLATLGPALVASRTPPAQSLRLHE